MLFFLCAIIFLYTFVLVGNEADRESKFLSNIGIGALAGTIEVACNQPFIITKNILQQEKKGCRRPNIVELLCHNPKRLWTGLGVNIIAQGPTTAVQIGVDEFLKRHYPQNDLFTVLSRNLVTGIASGASCNVTELIITNQIIHKKSALAVAKQLYQEHGKAVFLRGIGTKMIRDAGFCLGFLTLYGNAKKELKDLPPFLANTAAAAAVGIPTSLVTHPFDTVSIRLQADAGKKKYKSALEVFTTFIKNGQKKELWRGGSWRVLRVVVAIPLMSTIKDNGVKIFDK